MFKGRLGRLQRRCHHALIALGGEAKTAHLAEYCRPELVILRGGRPTRVQTASHARAARSIGAYRVRREGRQWLWRLADKPSDSDH
jgi:hypothetical protein